MNTPTTVVHTAPIQPHFEANLASLAQGSKPRAAPSLVHLDYAALLTSSSTDPLLRDQSQTFGPAGVRSIAPGGLERRPARSPTRPQPDERVDLTPQPVLPFAPPPVSVVPTDLDPA